MIMTVLGPIPDEAFGKAAIHEHVLVDFHEPGSPPREYDRADVIDVITPHLKALAKAGCRSFVDCTPHWLGRDPGLLKELAIRSGLHIVTNTGWYQPPMAPPEADSLPAERIAELWAGEAVSGFADAGSVRPGFIKIALGAEPEPPPICQKLLRAAIYTSRITGLPIVAHTVFSRGAEIAAHILESEGMDMERFIWAHADADGFNGKKTALDMARRGMWISVDGVREPYDRQIAMLRAMGEAGLLHRALLSQDSGWYNVGEPRGGTVRAYHTLFTEFLPKAASQGISQRILDGIVTANAAQSMRQRC